MSRPGKRTRRGGVPDVYGMCRGARTVGGYMPRHGGHTGEAWHMALAVEYQLAALNRDYPAWRITCVRRSDGRTGGWWAFRRARLGAAERAAGLYPCIARRTALDLVMEVSAQDDISGKLRDSLAVAVPEGEGNP
ncbi:hypothetical protein Ssi03_62890 [Sphaerisporangium siamense]|uniref:Uncharacterized protein n=1 Tax=Sphaerisporangium siamense TaxID=795645 RepID=A0A7W7D991_9ACTN|nr:hypothetical protein [Sphaerisporangium siamense]MBB4702597.1 hypothetical protein [Sphaerisporangium siamense]GII88299.1 hypothetical protein Ssi03_62890 [Sphaerisporangium siamense]